MKYSNLIVKYDDKQIQKMKRILNTFLEGYKNITFIVDTREKDFVLLNQLKKFKVNVRQEKLKYGDYGFEVPFLNINNDIVKCCYERKKNISEIISNMNDDKDNFGLTRFEREIYNAVSDGYNFKWVCGSGNWRDVYKGNYPSRTNRFGVTVKTNPNSLVGKIKSLETDLNIKLEFIPIEDMLFDICTFFKYIFP